MDSAIIGLEKSGKTTVFNALTRGHAETTAFGRTGLEPNIGVVKVPDARLDQLAALDKPQKFTPAEVRYTDIGGAATGLSKGEGIGGPLLNVLGRADALIHVVRAFPDPSVPHVYGSVDPARDINTVNLELAYSDAAIIERRLERIAVSLKAARPAEREAAAQEQEWLQELKAQLEEGVPLRELKLAEAQQTALASYALLTAKPLLLLINIGEEQLSEAPALEAHYRQEFLRPKAEVLALCGKLEMELAQMEPAEAAELREGLGLQEPATDRVVRVSYDLLGYISFFTTGPDETRAWTIGRHTPAPLAARKIHTDLEKGFIRAEVVGWQDLLACGAWAEARKRGLLRTEGKTYVVQDGDVLHILFSRP
ncbi:MAG: redox-regulated ATPase YchF [Chloroflexi bacterium]|nr:redox-regulated ATPase YchF [Chloroflexota bacterium]